MAIRAVLFDADGVTILPHRFADELERDHGLSRDDTKNFFRGPFESCLVGQADLPTEIAPFLAQWQWPYSVEAFLRRWFDAENTPNTSLLAIIQQLRTNGLPCYLATNQEHHRVTYMQTQMGFGSLFDGIFASAHLGAKKPDEIFYSRITQKLGLLNHEILFWDDTKVNVEAAQSHGWQAEQYTTLTNLQERMSTYTPGVFPMLPCSKLG